MRKIAIALVIIILLFGIAMMCYPLVSSIVNNIDYQNQAVAYEERIQQLPDENVEKLFEAAEKYNATLSNNAIISDPFSTESHNKLRQEYSEILNIDEYGMIGYIRIPAIDVNLPIYHSTSESVLSKGAGHIQNTSMPIGGVNTNAVISAHSAYPGKTFFDYLTDLKIGDVFYITVLNRTLKYEIDKIDVVLPTDTSGFAIVPERDLVTLVTCTPYSVNTHRLLVTGTRVETDSPVIKEESTIIRLNSDYVLVAGYKIQYWQFILALGIFLLLLIFTAVFAIRRARKKAASDVCGDNKDIVHTKEDET